MNESMDDKLYSSTPLNSSSIYWWCTAYFPCSLLPTLEPYIIMFYRKGNVWGKTVGPYCPI